MANALLPVPARRRLRAIVDRLGGAGQAADAIGVGTETIARAIAGFGLKKGSYTAIMKGIEAFDAAPSEPRAA